MTRSPYKPWLRNVHVRRVFLLVWVPLIGIPASLIAGALEELMGYVKKVTEAWQRHPSDKP